MSDAEPKRLFVDASAFITLAEIGHVDLLDGLDGEVVVPRAVADEVVDDPAASHLDAASGDWLRVVDAVEVAGSRALRHAATHLGSDRVGESEEADDEPALADDEEANDEPQLDFEGDVALLALGTTAENPVVVTGDKPLRDACKALGVPLSGSIGVVVAAVERGHLGADAAKDALVAMDEVGARLSARLLRRAERLVDEAGE